MKTNLEIIKEFGKNEKDSGSSQVQIAILTERINYLNEHLKQNKKDNHSRLGLVKMVNKRKKLSAYLKRKNETVYRDTLKRLNLRK